ncbi:hypothetical protein MMC07_001520 [Pseudocyphellaria aurata]|nr:hypothetical protein [Pseudocyphellaria aurata]
MFPFLKLPAEVRNEVYRLILLTRNVTTTKPRVKDLLRNPDEVANHVGSVQPENEADGTVRCECWRPYTLSYQISILRVNRQIYRETWGIFNLENFWTIVQINKAGFGKQMKDLGFPVAAVGECHHIRFPVMTASVTFPSLQDKRETDTLAVATIHLDQLMHGLWTAKGSSTMDVSFHLEPRRTTRSPSEADLLRPLFKLRSIKKVVMITGVSGPAYANELTSTITTTNGLRQAVDELTAGIRRVQELITAKQWVQVTTTAEIHVVFLHDCRVVYGQRFIGTVPGLNIHTAITRRQTCRAIYVATAVVMAQLAFHRRQYAKTVQITSTMLDLIARPSVVQPMQPANPNVIAAPQHPITISNPQEAEMTYFLLLFRARAYIATGKKSRRAMNDLERAGELKPGSKTVDIVKRLWQNAFGRSASRRSAASASH